MRLTLSLILAAAFVAPAPALAYENFIPMGHNYSPDDQVLPEFNSSQDQLTGQVDIIETEIYNRQRAAKEFQNRIEQFSNWQELNRSGPESIDY